MKAHCLRRRQSLLAVALARVESYLVEPEDVPAVPLPPQPRTIVAVAGVSRGCGTTTVARALAAELAARDGGGAAAVTARGRSAPAPAARAAARLARDLAIAAPGPAPPRAAGRLCLAPCADLAALARAARHRAPLVIDVRYGDPLAAAASLADHVVLVRSPDGEPALAEAVCASLDGLGSEPLLLTNRAPDGIPDSPVGARLAMAGRVAPGTFGAAIAALADRCERPR